MDDETFIALYKESSSANPNISIFKKLAIFFYVIAGTATVLSLYATVHGEESVYLIVGLFISFNIALIGVAFHSISALYQRVGNAENKLIEK